MSNFQPLEVVDRGSETQPRVVENLNKFTQQDKGGICFIITIIGNDLSVYCKHQYLQIIGLKLNKYK